MTNLTYSIEGFLSDYEAVIHEVFDVDLKKYIDQNKALERDWDYIQSAFFASTVLTTIGKVNLDLDSAITTEMAMIIECASIPLFCS